MTKLFRTLSTIAALQLILFVVLGSHAEMALAAEPEFDIAAAISAATTKADHEKIATFYEQQATELDAKIAQHQRMQNAYRHSGALRQHGVQMRAHCDKLIKNYRTAGTENRAMAKSHREMANKAPQ